MDTQGQTHLYLSGDWSSDWESHEWLASPPAATSPDVAGPGSWDGDGVHGDSLGGLDANASTIAPGHHGMIGEGQLSHVVGSGLARPGKVIDDSFLPHGAWLPVEPCKDCRRMRLQCFMLQTTEANPNPVESCSSCVALFRQCSLAERSKRQPHEYETSLPAIGQLHGVNEEDGTSYLPDDAGFLLGAVPMVHPSKRSSSRSVTRTRPLRNWFAANLDNPYPTEDEKTDLASETGMTRLQVNNWFTNARRRRRQSLKAIAKQSYFPQGSPMPRMSPSSMTPLERWRNSPPEEEAVSSSAIQKALDGVLHNMKSPGPVSAGSSGHHSASSSVSGHSWAYSRPQSACESSNSASSSCVYQSDDSGSFFLGPTGSVGEGGTSPGAVPVTSGKQVNVDRPVFQCTFCQRRFKKKFDWMRHERSVHVPGLDSWVCSLPLPADQSPLIWRVGRDDRECMLCGQQSPTNEHFQSHEFESCAERAAHERVFNRKDHLWQHLYKFHGCRKWEGWTPDLSILRVSLDEVRSRCGFCDVVMESWTQRESHLTSHFRAGMTMAQWRGGGNGGVENVPVPKAEMPD